MQASNLSICRFGHLNAMIFRACRLVVDTGIHALGWSRSGTDWASAWLTPLCREQAEQFLTDHTSRSEGSIRREVSR